MEDSPWLAPLVIMMMGGFTLFFILRAARVSTMLSWPTAEGRVTGTQISGGYRQSSLNVAYTYSVSGSTYQGEQVGYATRRWSNALTPIIESLPQTQQVHYNPDNPAESGLHIGLQSITQSATRWAVAFGITFVLLVAVYVALEFNLLR